MVNSLDSGKFKSLTLEVAAPRSLTKYCQLLTGAGLWGVLALTREFRDKFSTVQESHVNSSHSKAPNLTSTSLTPSTASWKGSSTTISPRSSVASKLKCTQAVFGRLSGFMPA